GSESRRHWTLALAALLTALVVGAFIFSRRPWLRGARAIAITDVAESTLVPDGSEILPPVTVRSTDSAADDRQPPPTAVAADEARPSHAATPASRTSGVVTARSPTTNGNSRGDQADPRPAEES